MADPNREPNQTTIAGSPDQGEGLIHYLFYRHQLQMD